MLPSLPLALVQEIVDRPIGHLLVIDLIPETDLLMVEILETALTVEQTQAIAQAGETILILIIAPRLIETFR
jgi:hypothetical protein